MPDSCWKDFPWKDFHETAWGWGLSLPFVPQPPPVSEWGAARTPGTGSSATASMKRERTLPGASLKATDAATLAV